MEWIGWLFVLFWAVTLLIVGTQYLFADYDLKGRGGGAAAWLIGSGLAYMCYVYAPFTINFKLI